MLYFGLYFQGLNFDFIQGLNTAVQLELEQFSKCREQTFFNRKTAKHASLPLAPDACLQPYEYIKIFSHLKFQIVNHLLFLSHLTSASRLTRGAMKAKCLPWLDNDCVMQMIDPVGHVAIYKGQM